MCRCEDAEPKVFRKFHLQQRKWALCWGFAKRWCWEVCRMLSWDDVICCVAGGGGNTDAVAISQYGRYVQCRGLCSHDTATYDCLSLCHCVVHPKLSVSVAINNLMKECRVQSHVIGDVGELLLEAVSCLIGVASLSRVSALGHSCVALCCGLSCLGQLRVHCCRFHFYWMTSCGHCNCFFYTMAIEWLFWLSVLDWPLL